MAEEEKTEEQPKDTEEQPALPLLLNIKKRNPERFGFFVEPKNGEKPTAVSFTRDNSKKAVFNTNLELEFEQYKRMKKPFGIALIEAGGKKSLGFVVDLDKHFQNFLY